jgi:hypothetical protein
MSTSSVQPPYEIFTDIDGQPLEDGYIWLGTAGLPAISNPITAYWNAALTIPATQPIRTTGGYPMNAGTPARIYVAASDYSILVQNKNGSSIYSSLNATERYSSALVTFLQAGANAVTRTAQSKMRDIVSVKDFGAVGDGVTDDTAAIQAAITFVRQNGGGTVFFSNGTFKISSTIVVGYSDVKLQGEGKGDFHYTGTSPVAATRILWAGSSTGQMVNFQPAGTQWISGCGINGIFLDGGSGVERLVTVYSNIAGNFIVHGQNFSVSAVLFGVVTLAPGETADCQENYCEIRANAVGSISINAGLLQLTGVTAANSSFNRFGFIDGNYQNGTAIQLYNCDNNLFDQIRLYRQPGATGTGIVLNAGNLNEEARQNLFINCSPGEGGLTANGTASGASASKENYILYYDTRNGAPLPVYGTGATLWYNTTDNKFPASSMKDSSATSYGAGPADVTWNDTSFNLQNNFVGATFTAPKPGRYRVNWKLSYQAASAVAGDKWAFYLVTSSAVGFPAEQIGFIHTVPNPAVDNSVEGCANVSLGYNATVKLTVERAAGTGNFKLIGDARFNRIDVSYIAQCF